MWKQIKTIYGSLDWKANPWYVKPLEWAFFVVDILAHCVFNSHEYIGKEGQPPTCLWCGKEATSTQTRPADS